jgi:hypothetical protein
VWRLLYGRVLLWCASIALALKWLAAADWCLDHYNAVRGRATDPQQEQGPPKAEASPTLRQLTAAWVRMQWAWLRFILACALARTTPAEMRRQRRLLELTGRWPPTQR